MKQTEQTKNKISPYPWLYLFSAIVGSACIFAPASDAPLLFGSALLLPLAILAANVFSAAWVVTGTEIQTVSHPNPRARFFENEPETIEMKMYRVPLLPVLLAVVGALVSGFLSGSPLVGLIVLLLWGVLSYPLALGILYRNGFALSLQSGLIVTSLVTALAGVLQVFVWSPGHTFQLQYCYDVAYEKVKTILVNVLTETKATPEGAALLKDLNLSELADAAITSTVSMAPALFAIAVLAVLCLIWWLIKALLKRDARVDVKYMGRLDGYAPSRTVSLLYLLFFFLYFFGTGESALELMGMNVFYVISAVLLFAGFSFVLFIINTRISSRGWRIALTVGAVLLGGSSLGGQLLVLAGLLCAGNDLRGRFGGGTLQ